MITAQRVGFKSRVGNSTAATYKIIPSKMGKIFVWILLIAVFEGALRKWVSTGFTIPLLLLRDGLAIYGTYWAFKTAKLKLTQQGTLTLLFWSILVLLWGLFQVVVTQNSPLVLIIGLRFWLLYLWFAYAAAMSITQNDFRYIISMIFKLLLIMLPLAIMQFYLPPSAFLNKQLDDDVKSVFTVTADIVRTTGTFTFTLGYTIFLSIVNPFVFSVLTPGSRVWRKKWMPNFLVLALATATIISGSRSALGMFTASFLVYSLVSLRYSKSALQRSKTLVTILTMISLLSLVPFFLSRAVDANKERIEAANEVEDPIERVQGMFFGSHDTYDNFSFIGHGIGLGNNLSSFVVTGEQTFLLGETEADRIINEGGIFGFAYIGLKLIVIVIGLRKSFFIANKTGNSLPLMLWITLSVGLSSWQIIFQMTVNVFGYLLLGLGIASLRLGYDPSMGKLK